MLNICVEIVENWRGTLLKRSPEKKWVRIRSAILDRLERFPDARVAVLQVLVELRAADEGECR